MMLGKGAVLILLVTSYSVSDLKCQRIEGHTCQRIKDRTCQRIQDLTCQRIKDLTCQQIKDGPHEPPVNGMVTREKMQYFPFFMLQLVMIIM